MLLRRGSPPASHRSAVQRRTDAPSDDAPICSRADPHVIMRARWAPRCSPVCVGLSLTGKPDRESREAIDVGPKAVFSHLVGTLSRSPKQAVESPGWSSARVHGTRRTRYCCSHTRAGGDCTFRDDRSRRSRSAPSQQTLRFQGFTPLTNPLRPTAVSSGDSLAPPMGFVPLQGLLVVRFRPPLGRSHSGPASWFPPDLGSRGAVAIHGGTSHVDPSGSCPALRKCTGGAFLGEADGLESCRGAFSASSRESIARPGVPAPKR